MISDLNRIIEQVGKDKGIEKEVLIEALESAMLTAARKVFGPYRDIEAQYNHDVGEVEIFEFKTVVQDVINEHTEITIENAKSLDEESQYGDSIGQKLDTSSLGRISAQMAKQVIIQKIRDAERDMIYKEYKDRKGDIVTGNVQRFERGDMVVNLGRAEAVMPSREQIPKESYRQGDRIRAYIYEVLPASKGPQIFLSRTHPGLLEKLFEVEVPEIYEGIVEIKSAAREPGERAKIGVISYDPDVDPVGACVGMKGSRVQAVVQELRGERIDIVNWSSDPPRFVCSALSPAEISKVIIDDSQRTMEIIVADDQLSLAIGKKGQNVRLAAKLTGWRIDIRGETGLDGHSKEVRDKLEAIPGIGGVTAVALLGAGYDSARAVAEADAESLAQVSGIGSKKAEKFKAAARQYLVQKREEQRRAAMDARAAAAAKAAIEQARKISGEEIKEDQSGVQGVEEDEGAESSDQTEVAVESEEGEGKEAAVESEEGEGKEGEEDSSETKVKSSTALEVPAPVGDGIVDAGQLKPITGIAAIDKKDTSTEESP